MSKATPSPPRRMRRRAGALAATLALASGAALVAAPAALATFPGANGKIAFERGGDIWTVNPDGTGERRVTSGPHVDSAPDWSPDGKELLFERRSLPPAAPSSHVYRVKADGAGLTWVAADGHEPDWFRDGKRLVFTRDLGDFRDLYMANRDGSGQKRIANGMPAVHGPDPSPTSDFVLANHLGANSDGYLFAGSQGFGFITWHFPDQGEYDQHQGSWAPDGRRIAFFQGTGAEWHGPSPDPRLGVAVMDTEGVSVKVVAQDGTDPAFAPDGTRIAFVHGTSIRTMRADGSDKRTLGRGSDPDWQAKR